MSMETIIILSLLSAILLSIIISMIIILRKFKHIEEKISSISEMSTSIMNSIDNNVITTLANIKSSCTDLKTNVRTHNQELASLTSSVQSVLKQEIQKKKAKVYPTSHINPLL